MKEYVLDGQGGAPLLRRQEGQGTNKVLYVLLKHVGEQRARHYVQVLQHVATMIEVDAAQPLGAAEMKHKYKLGYADSVAATGRDVESKSGIRRSGIRKAW